jgi:hypothetical protein
VVFDGAVDDDESSWLKRLHAALATVRPNIKAIRARTRE